MHKTQKQNKLKKSDFDEFMGCHKSEDRFTLRETKSIDRWKLERTRGVDYEH